MLFFFIYRTTKKKMFWLNQQKGSTRVAFWWDQTKIKFLVIIMKNSVCLHQNVLFLFDPFGGLIRTLFSRYNKIIITNTITVITIKMKFLAIIILPCNYNHKYQKLFFQWCFQFKFSSEEKLFFNASSITTSLSAKFGAALTLIPPRDVVGR